MDSAPGVSNESPTVAQAFWVWLKVGVLSFGGPAGQIALMHRLVVDEKHWVSEAQFLHALNFCMLLPGPEAQQLATYIGWLLHGTRGALIAGILFVAPGAVVMLTLSFAYVMFQQVAVVDAIFLGVKAAVLVVVIQALLKIRKRVLKNPPMKLLAGAAFVAIFFFSVPFPIIILAAAIVGIVLVRLRPQSLATQGEAEIISTQATLTMTAPSIGRSLRITVFGTVLWFAPVVLAASLLGTEHVLVDEGLFFSKLAVVTFGGAYAVLSYVAQQAVEVHHWLQAGEMVDGLGLAESTPGPLIMVVQFVGFLGAYRQPGTLDPATAAVLASCVTVWVTFVPCFMWIFLGAPYVERLRHNRQLNGALSCVTAAVVGVILNLALWFGIHVLFGEVERISFALAQFLVPVWSSVQWLAVLLSALGAVAMFRFHFGLARCFVLTVGLAVLVTTLT